MRILSSVILFFIIFSTSAQENYVIIDDATELNKIIKSKSQNIHSIKSDFIQHKNLSILEETLVSEGNFLFKKENNIKWQYTSPFNYTITISKGKFKIDNEGKLSEFDMNSNEMFKQINNMIVTAISGDFIDNPEFEVKFYKNKDFYKAELTPVDNTVSEMLSSISIYFHKEHYHVDKIKFLEPGDDYTLIIFNNRQENIHISEDDFNIN